MADATGQPLDKIEEDTDRDFFMTPEGCSRGGPCTFEHQKLTPEDKRCYNCGSLEHRSPVFERPKRDPSGQKGKGEKGKGKGKTNADMKSMGRGLAKIANQKRG